MFLAPTEFKFVDTLESNYAIIRQELDHLQQTHFIPWPETTLYNQGWDVFGLYAFGRKLEANCCLCPETARLVAQIPGMTTAGFSRLAPGTQITPHVGYTNVVLRCHLGVIVPDGCALRVGAEVRQWQEGKCLIFDDTVEHEAWHHGSTDRIVLLVDFQRSAQEQSPSLDSNLTPAVMQLLNHLPLTHLSNS